jgi:hypothetical protein
MPYMLNVIMLNAVMLSVVAQIKKINGLSLCRFQRNMGYRPSNYNTVFIGPATYKFNVRRKMCDFAVPVQGPML